MGPWDALLVSPLRRAAETAAPIAVATGIPARTVSGLAEIGGPDWQGAPIERVHRIFEEQRHRPVHQWWDGFPGGGESFHQFHQRVTSTVAEVLAGSGVRERGEPHLWEVPEGAGRLLVVAHAGTNAVALGYLLGLEPAPWEWERFLSPHASISRITSMPLAGANIMALAGFADTAHLTEVTY